MKGIFVLILFVGLSLISDAQEFGFLGKKNVISVNFTANPRLLSGLNLDLPLLNSPAGYKVNTYNSKNVLKTRSKIFRYDLRASYKRILNRKIALGLEFGYEKMKLPSRDAYSSYDIYAQNGWYLGTQEGYFSSPVFNVLSYMIVLELFSENSIAPAGFSTSFGIGPKFYSFNKNQNYRSSPSDEILYPFPDYEKSMMAIDIFYDLTYRVPISRFLMFDIGMRIRTGFLFERPSGYDTNELIPGTYSTANPFQWTKTDLIRDMRTENVANFINLKAGFTFVL
ncbi:MAG: hypothetical protein MK105_04955 [Crocinitomicaceae bacterium]|nr:hypothetical protein [Crocinitomicaceae bacterium]